LPYFAFFALSCLSAHTQRPSAHSLSTRLPALTAHDHRLHASCGGAGTLLHTETQTGRAQASTQPSTPQHTTPQRSPTLQRHTSGGRTSSALGTDVSRRYCFSSDLLVPKPPCSASQPEPMACSDSAALLPAPKTPLLLPADTALMLARSAAKRCCRSARRACARSATTHKDSFTTRPQGAE
jgi:hypothetical protein